MFAPEALLREARRQKALASEPVPETCLLDPDGDIVRHLHRTGEAKPLATWPCYHTRLSVFEIAGRPVGIGGCAVGAPFAVLVAEQLFASGCTFLISLTSAGQITPSAIRLTWFSSIARCATKAPAIITGLSGVR